MFAIFWGFLLILDLLFQKTGYAQLYSFQDGTLFPIFGQLAQVLAIFSFIYFLFDYKNREARRFYGLMNTIFVVVAVSCLSIDFGLKVFALDSFYCQHLVPSDFISCKEGLQAALWRHFLVLAIIIRVYTYALSVIR